MYNKQTWLDEIPDMTKPIYDASGKQKTDPQTGRPLFELVQVGTRITSNRLNTMEGGIEAAHTLVEQLAKELGGNFVASTDGVMGLQCIAQGLKASWTSGVAYVGGRRYQVAAGEMSLNPTQGQYLYVDTDGVVKKTTSQTTAQKGLVFFYVATDTSGVISTTDHRVTLNLEEILKKLQDVDIEEAVTGGASGLMTGADAKFVRVDGETKTGAQEKADAVKDYVKSRLDTSERSEVTLQPGLQVIQGKRNAPFSLTGLKGRTFVNLLGRVGGMENISQWDTYQGSVSLSTSNKVEGSNGLMIAVGSADSFATATAKNKVSVKANKFYIAAVNVLNAFASSSVFYVNGLTSTKGFYPATLNSEFDLLWRAYAPTADAETEFILQVNSDEENQYAYFDAARFYEISAAEYAALDNMTRAQIAAKYPYVDSVQPVRNPYAIRYGENLLPPFYEWRINDGVNSWVEGPYTLSGVASAGNQPTDSPLIRVPVGTTLTLTGGGNGANGYLQIINKSKTAPLADNTGSEYALFTATEGNNEFYVRAQVMAAGSHTIKNPMLNIGSTPKPFKPREDAMLALQTDLFADPVSGANADEVFEKDGQFFKLAKWKKRLIDGSLSYQLLASLTGMKEVYVAGLTGANNPVPEAIMSKYDEGLLTRLEASKTAPNLFGINTVTGTLYITISAADSGWGDSYTPTADEIKAYFMGWIMYLSGTGGSGKSGITPYNGTGTKYWARVASDGNTLADGTSVLPTTQAPNYTPYQLVYQLATPTVEPITSEGQLTFIEGDNQIEVGTGIVLRESTKAVMTRVGTTEYYHFNNMDPIVNNPFKYRVEKILNIYANGKRANGVVLKNEEMAYGKQDAHIEGKDFNKDAAYSVTYLMLATSPIASFVGSIPDNEKALLTDLVQDVQQANARLSVVESKKAEKDAPAWITPTLLNGWVPFGDMFNTAQFYKDANNVVRVRGFIRYGVTTIFVFPAGYRPREKTLAVPVVSATDATGTGVAAGTINILPDGQVQPAVNIKNGFVTLDGITFLAEH